MHITKTDIQEEAAIKAAIHADEAAVHTLALQGVQELSICSATAVL